MYQDQPVPSSSQFIWLEWSDRLECQCQVTRLTDPVRCTEVRKRAALFTILGQVEQGKNHMVSKLISLIFTNSWSSLGGRWIEYRWPQSAMGQGISSSLQFGSKLQSREVPEQCYHAELLKPSQKKMFSWVSESNVMLLERFFMTFMTI